MPELDADIDRSHSFGDLAFGQIKGRKLSAMPRNYEVWYTYASGYHTELSDAVNEVLSSRRAIAQDDLDRIYEAYLSQTRLTDKIDVFGDRVVDEIEHVMTMIDSAAGHATAYGQDLAGASAKLATTGSTEGLRSIIENLVRSTREIEANNKALEQRLKASRTEIKQLQENLDAVRTESLTDPLTSLGNRKFYDQAISKSLALANKSGTPMALLISDIDHFKKFNDTFGHLTGDQVLRLVALSVKQNVKGQDLACRYGGEEFAIILPDTTLRAAVTVAEHIRRAVMTKELIKRSTSENLGRITVSLGVAAFRPGDTVATLYERADRCLYAAKRNGRNRVICETDPEADSVPAKVA
ncbi:GGDEF domain-containing protein [Phreatobacter aquaticus]|uniref:diguanylate cyclase n=1 Tax=Phreatobacter aquaticus TaxID=2570229 RepID=A0A4D7QIY5_9HYPH|nr:GGDEF domain-containing protein [Phreatobacter aquaticus]QCK87630.1 GGDEF domain-containing protein [Phreatobacter aquaticus]